MEKTEEYNQPLGLVYGDFEKAFDAIVIWNILGSMQKCLTDCRYVQVMRGFYEAAKMTVQA